MVVEAFWVPVMFTEASESKFADYYTGDPVKKNALSPGNLFKGDMRCGITSGPRGFMERDCEVDRSKRFMCACQHEKQSYMTLRGLCEDSNLDKFLCPGTARTMGRP